MSNDVYSKPVLMTFDNAVVKVYRPILTDKEREKQMKAIHDAAAVLLKSAESKKP